MRGIGRAFASRGYAQGEGNDLGAHHFAGDDQLDATARCGIVRCHGPRLTATTHAVRHFTSTRTISPTLKLSTGCPPVSSFSTNTEMSPSPTECRPEQQRQRIQSTVVASNHDPRNAARDRVLLVYFASPNLNRPRIRVSADCVCSNWHTLLLVHFTSLICECS